MPGGCAGGDNLAGPYVSPGNPATDVYQVGVGINPAPSATGIAGVTVINESVLVHEALHGITGYGDLQLEKVFCSGQGNAGSECITAYIRNYVLNYCGIGAN
jgi:hypothetical protein